MKYVHCADVHIGMEFALNKLKSRQRKAEILQSFLSLVEYCRNEAVDILLIAGDLFDNENVDAAVVEQVKSALGSIPQTDVYVAPGNHDAYTITSPYRDEGWSDNVTIFNGTPRVIERADKGYRIWGCGFESCFVMNRLLMGVRLPKDELVNIGILHGQLVGKNGKSEYNAITDSDIEKSGIDYLALGHVHKQTGVQRIGDTLYAYSGTTEGQGFDEEGIRGFYTGELSKQLLGRHELIAEYVSTSRRRYYHVNVDVTGALNRAQVVDRICSAAQGVTEDDEFAVLLTENRAEDNLYKVTLTGDISEEAAVSVDELSAQLFGKFYYIKLRDNTRLLIDYEELAKENSLKGMYTARMLDNIRMQEQAGNEKGAALYRKALELGIRAFEGEVGVDEN